MAHPPEDDHLYDEDGNPKPGARKPPARKPASRDKGKAAVAEKDEPQPKVAKFRDLEITLPPELPATFLFDIAELEAADNDPMPMFRFLRSVAGPDQFTAVRNALTPEDTVEEVLDTLLDSIFAQYGLSVGEASASPES